MVPVPLTLPSAPCSSMFSCFSRGGLNTFWFASRLSVSCQVKMRYTKLKAVVTPAAFLVGTVWFALASSFQYPTAVHLHCPKHPIGYLAPFKSSGAIAGTAVLGVPTMDCIQKLQASRTRSVFGSSAIFCDIRAVNVPRGYYIEILDGGFSTLVLKEVHGDKGADNETKIQTGQMLSSYQRFPSISVRFVEHNRSRGTKPQDGSVELRWTVIYKTTRSKYTYCPSLQGYVYGELICDKSNRINCPDTYQPQIAMENSASGSQGCESIGTQGAWTKTAVGTTLGGVAVIAVGVIIVWWTRKRTAQARQAAMLRELSCRIYKGPAARETSGETPSKSADSVSSDWTFEIPVAVRTPSPRRIYSNVIG